MPFLFFYSAKWRINIVVVVVVVVVVIVVVVWTVCVAGYVTRRSYTWQLSEPVTAHLVSLLMLTRRNLIRSLSCMTLCGSH